MTNYLRWDAGQVTLTERDATGGWQTAQVNTYGDGGTAPMLYHSPYGVMGRPLDPDDDGACQALWAYEGDQGHVWPTLDTRALGKLPALKKGGSVVYDSAGSFGVFDPEEHTHTLYVPVEFDGDGTPTKAHLVQVGKDANGLRCITLLHADGPAISILEGGKNSIVIKNAASDAYVEVNDDGIVLNGKVTIKGGLKSDEGAGVVPLARATEVQAFCTNVLAVVNALVAKVNALPPASAIPVVAPLSPSVVSTTLSG